MSLAVSPPSPTSAYATDSRGLSIPMAREEAASPSNPPSDGSKESILEAIADGSKRLATTRAGAPAAMTDTTDPSPICEVSSSTVERADARRVGDPSVAAIEALVSKMMTK